ncbi:MAG: hypothetical protein LBE08_07540 [Bifidobacteriaceae bacterium]|jgi:hypothetical protein|nr:hypothetical protein [Bifidobacteriaceae bacterium]
MRTFLEILGWAGSITVVASLMVSRQRQFRWMNLAGSLVATGYNAALAIWPFVLMNGAIVVIDAYWLARLRREAAARSAGLTATDRSPGRPRPLPNEASTPPEPGPSPT